MNTEKELIDKLVAEFNEILSLEQNMEAKKNWLEFASNLKPSTCDTRVGLHWEKCISVDCKFTKGADSDIFRCIAKGISDDIKPDILSFLQEQKPEHFHFNPKMILKDSEILYFRFTIHLTKK